MGVCMVSFLSSRRRHTRLVSDWSSDVCSSDLLDRKIRELARPDVSGASRFQGYDVEDELHGHERGGCAGNGEQQEDPPAWLRRARVQTAHLFQDELARNQEGVGLHLERDQAKQGKDR